MSSFFSLMTAAEIKSFCSKYLDTSLSDSFTIKECGLSFITSDTLSLGSEHMIFEILRSPIKLLFCETTNNLSVFLGIFPIDLRYSRTKLSVESFCTLIMSLLSKPPAESSGYSKTISTLSLSILDILERRRFVLCSGRF